MFCVLDDVFAKSVMWPLAARAQQSTMPVVGYLGTTTPDDFAFRVAAFDQRLSGRMQ